MFRLGIITDEITQDLEKALEFASIQKLDCFELRSAWEKDPFEYTDEDFFLPEIETFYNVIKSGKPDKTKRDYIAPVYIIEATIKSYEKNKEVDIDIPFI